MTMALLDSGIVTTSTACARKLLKSRILLWKRYGVYKPADLDIRVPYTAFELEW